MASFLNIQGFGSITALKKALPVTARYLRGRGFHGDGFYIAIGPRPTAPVWKVRVRVVNGHIIQVSKMAPLRPGG